MWIQESRGRLRLYERYTDIDGKERKTSVPLLKDTPKERKESYTKLMLKINAQKSGGAEIRYDDLVEKYISRDDIKESTVSGYRYMYGAIGKIIGNPYVSQINNAFVRRKMSESDKSLKLKNSYIHALKQLIKYAREFGYTSEVLEITPYKERRTEDIEDKYLSAEELNSVLEQLEGSMYYYMCKFMALTGCRIGEASALTLSDIEGNYVHVTKTLWNGHVHSAKTESSKRDIFIQNELRELLNEYMQYRNIKLFAHGIRTNQLFFNERGNPISTKSMSVKLLSLECPKHLHAHIFRHTHASLLAEAGYSLDAISRRLGHSDSEITKKIYLHVTEKMRKKEEEQLNEIRLLI